MVCGIWSFYSFKQSDEVNQQMAAQIREIEERRSQRASEAEAAQRLKEENDWKNTGWINLQ